MLPRFACPAHQRVPMTPARRKRAGDSFHDAERFTREMLEIFDINPIAGMSPDDVTFAKLRFARRAVYEHRGGLVDQDYLDASDDSKLVGQALKETPGNIRNFCEITLKMAMNISNGFHDIFPPDARATKS